MLKAGLRLIGATWFVVTFLACDDWDDGCSVAASKIFCDFRVLLVSNVPPAVIIMSRRLGLSFHRAEYARDSTIVDRLCDRMKR